uniref:succinate dehydrogenase subunit 4 n=1 Tax=Pseudoceramium inkyui TaxID=196910 RepID=UPI002E764A02|nr:succinate dehydrogenase subunit 4 [Pseudoceramium inkyui]WQF69635.1 succinate dehydrogenase subunit 4 [Pseudoceramium inkyui]
MFNLKLLFFIFSINLFLFSALLDFELLFFGFFFFFFHFTIGLSSILNDYIYLNPIKIFFNCLLKISSLEVLQYSIELLF